MMVGAVFQSPYNERLRRLCRKIVALLPFPELLSWLAKRHVRKTLFALCLISVAILSLTSQGQLAFGSTVTSTRTTTSTEWTTISTTLTSTRYSTSTVTDTSTFTRTSTSFTTITPTTTKTIDERSTTTIYLPTTTWTTQRPTSLRIEIEVLPQSPILKQTHTVRVRVINSGSSSVSLLLDISETFDGDPKQLVGPAGTLWPLDAKVDPSDHDTTVQVNAGQSTSRDFDFRSEWNWVEPVDTKDRLVDLALLILSAYFNAPTSSAAAMLKALVDAISAGKAGFDSPIAAMVAKFSVPSEHFTVKASASGAQVSDASKEIALSVPDWKRSALITWALTCLASLVIPIVVAVLAAIALAILTGGGALPAWLVISQYVITAVDAALLGASWGLYDSAADPRANYLELDAPAQQPIPPIIEQLPEGAGKDLAVAAFNYQYYVNASAIELSRYAGAEEAAQTEFMITHLENANNYLEDARNELVKMSSYYQGFSAQLPGLNSTSVAMGRDYIRANGLPNAAKEALHSLGADDVTSTIVKSIIQAPEQVYQIPVDKLFSSASYIIQNQTASISKEVESLRARQGKPAIPQDYLLMIGGAIVLATIAIYVIMTRRRSVSIRPPGGLFCRRCGVQNRLGAGFCRHCGTPLHRAGIPCRSCRTPNRPTASFCRRCGTRLH
jgi:ribosomal protein L40E